MRIFADSNGESHFEEAELEGEPGQVTAESRRTLLCGPLPASALTFVEPATSWVGDTVTLRWHVIEETPRHAGHADLIRQHIDGATGYLPQDLPY